MKAVSAGLLTSVTALFGASAALAGPAPVCGVAGGPACDAGSVLVATPPAYGSSTTVANHTPYDFLDSIHFQRSPHVSITRIHGMAGTPGLTDSPKGFTGGCHPESTAYCRSGGSQSTPATASAPAPAPRQPIISTLPRTVTARPAATRPVISRTVAPRPVTFTPAPARPVASPCSGFAALNPCAAHSSVSGGFQSRGVISERVVAVGRVSPPSAFVPRIYGDPYTIAPGIAHLPTSVIDRNPYSAQAVLDRNGGGVTPALSGLRFGPLPRPAAPVFRPAVQPVLQPAVLPAAQPFVRPLPVFNAPQVARPVPQGRYGPVAAPVRTTVPGGRYGVGAKPYPGVCRSTGPSPCNAGKVGRSRY